MRREKGESSRVHLLPFHLSFLVGRVVVLPSQVFFLSLGLVGRIDNIKERFLHNFPFLVLRNV